MSSVALHSAASAGPRGTNGPPLQAINGIAPPLFEAGPKRPAPTVERSFCDGVLGSTSRSAIDAALDEFRREFTSVADQATTSQSAMRAVCSAFNDYGRFIVAWNEITWLCQLANVPTFPINPDKVALLLSVYVELPCSGVVRNLMRHRQHFLCGSDVLLLLDDLRIAGTASASFFPKSTSFCRGFDKYPSTSVVAMLSGYVPPEYRQRSFAPQKTVSTRPTDRSAGSKFQPIPASRFAPPGTASSNTVPLKRTLRELCTQLPSILHATVFDVAQVRFQNASSAPAYVDRMPDLVDAAVRYTDLTALLNFPTYPIDAVKLAVFGLAHTPGPLGDLLRQASPEIARQRDRPRLSGKAMEKLMKDVTSVRDITRGGSVAITAAEGRDWRDWLKELTLDWKSVEPSEPTRPRPSQSGPPRKRAKLSPSPTNSDVARHAAVTLTSRPQLSSKKSNKASRTERATPTPSVASVSSPEVSAKPAPARRGRKPKGAKKESPALAATARSRKDTVSGSSRASTPCSAAVTLASSKDVPQPEPAPRWVPKVKGVIPAHIPPPPLPNVMPSPRWLKKNRVTSDGSEDDGGDDDEPVRTIATSRPKRRGGLQMIPVDVEALWSLAKSVGYTEEALAAAIAADEV
ncbi:hypothetical protein JCM10212_005175 [Sporobolomyces blumeae]